MSCCWYDIGYTNDYLSKMCKTKGSWMMTWPVYYVPPRCRWAWWSRPSACGPCGSGSCSWRRASSWAPSPSASRPWARGWRRGCPSSRSSCCWGRWGRAARGSREEGDVIQVLLLQSKTQPGARLIFFCSGTQGCRFLWQELRDSINQSIYFQEDLLYCPRNKRFRSVES